MRIGVEYLPQSYRLVLPLLLTGFALFVGCGSSDDWVCKTDKNRNGDSVQFSLNKKTGEIGAASKACD